MAEYLLKDHATLGRKKPKRAGTRQAPSLQTDLSDTYLEVRWERSRAAL